jgi:hypothetical protein
MPTERRMKPSAMPSSARRSGGTLAWVMMAGCSMRDSTPPRFKHDGSSRVQAWITADQTPSGCDAVGHPARSLSGSQEIQVLSWNVRSRAKPSARTSRPRKGFVVGTFATSVLANWVEQRGGVDWLASVGLGSRCAEISGLVWSDTVSIMISRQLDCERH